MRHCGWLLGLLSLFSGLQNLSARFNSAMDIPAQGLCRIPEKRS